MTDVGEVAVRAPWRMSVKTDFVLKKNVFPPVQRENVEMMDVGDYVTPALQDISAGMENVSVFPHVSQIHVWMTDVGPNVCVLQVINVRTTYVFVFLLVKMGSVEMMGVGELAPVLLETRV
jgi:hypothetical protein